MKLRNLYTKMRIFINLPEISNFVYSYDTGNNIRP